MNNEDNLLLYYQVVRDSLRGFDDIIARLVLQGSTVVLALITACLIAYREDEPIFSFVLVVGAILLTAVLLCKLWIYTDILQIGIATAIDLERKIFGHSTDPALRFDPESPKTNLNIRFSENLRNNPANKLGRKTKIILRGIFIALGFIQFLLLFFILSKALAYNSDAHNTVKPPPGKERMLTDLPPNKKTHKNDISHVTDYLIKTYRGVVYFRSDSATLMPGALSEIYKASAILSKYPHLNLNIEGHTDSTASEDYNIKLSNRRIDTVKNALINTGISQDRLIEVIYGESAPISSNKSLNRRVQLLLSKRKD